MKKTLKKIFLLPFRFIGYVLAIFTGSNSFVANPIIGSYLLNRLGLHVFRIVLAHMVTRFRWTLLMWKMPKEWRQEFHQNGFLVIKDFLPDEQFQQLRQKAETVTGEARELAQGDARTQRILLDDESLSGQPELKQFIRGRQLNNALDYCGGFAHPALFYLQRIRNGKPSAGWTEFDPQKNIHSDTFYPTMKAWYFLDDVKAEDGPFTYVPGSHKLSWARLKWEYKKSITVQTVHDGYSEKGAMRASLDDLKSMGMEGPKALPLPANSLVIANTHGFHCRGQAKAGRGRFEIWAYMRKNPFIPLPKLMIRAAQTVEQKTLRWYWGYLDQRNARRGVPSTWHLIDHKEVTKK